MAEVARLPSATNSPAGAFLGLSSQTASMAGLADSVSKTGQHTKRTLFVDNDNTSARTASQFASQTDPDQSAAKRRCCRSERFAIDATASYTSDAVAQCCSSSSSCHNAPAQGPEAAGSAAVQIVQEQQQQAEQMQQQQQQHPKGLTSPLKLRFKLLKTEAGTTVSWCNASAGCNNNSSISTSSSCCTAAAGAESSADTCCYESTSAAAARANNTVPEQQQQQQQPKGLTSPLKLRFKLLKTKAGTTVSWCNAAAGCNNNNSSSTISSRSCCAAAEGAESSADTCCYESTSAAAAAYNTVPEQQQQQQQQCRKANARRASLAIVRGYITKHRNSKRARKQLQQVLSNSEVAEQLASAVNSLQQQQQETQDADVLMDTAAAAAEAPQADVYVSHCTICHRECNEFDDDDHDCQHCGAHCGLKQLQTTEQQQCVSKWVADKIMDEMRGYAGQHGGKNNRGLVLFERKVKGEMPPKSRLGFASQFA